MCHGVRSTVRECALQPLSGPPRVEHQPRYNIVTCGCREPLDAHANAAAYYYSARRSGIVVAGVGAASETRKEWEWVERIDFLNLFFMFVFRFLVDDGKSPMLRIGNTFLVVYNNSNC